MFFTLIFRLGIQHPFNFHRLALSFFPSSCGNNLRCFQAWKRQYYPHRYSSQEYFSLSASPFVYMIYMILSSDCCLSQVKRWTRMMIQLSNVVAFTLIFFSTLPISINSWNSYANQPMYTPFCITLSCATLYYELVCRADVIIIAGQGRRNRLLLMNVSMATDWQLLLSTEDSIVINYRSLWSFLVNLPKPRYFGLTAAWSSFSDSLDIIFPHPSCHVHPSGPHEYRMGKKPQNMKISWSVCSSMP